MGIFSLGLAAALAWSVADSSAPVTWPEFRGPRGDGLAQGARLPLTWSESDHVRWKTAIDGKGWSSPVVWGDQIWLTTADEDGTAMFAVCVDRRSGEVVHDVLLWEVPEPDFCHPKNSYATPTPTIEDGRVYVHFGTFGTACLDTGTGEVLWTRRDLHCNHHRGPASSPIVYENLLMLTYDGYDVQYVVALDKRTGDTVWRRDRNIDYGTSDGDAMKAYVTPSVIEVDGHLELVSPSAGATVAYAPLTGEELWRVRSGGMNASARPLFGNGLVYCTTAAGGLQLFAVRPGGSGDVTKSHLAWNFDRNAPTRSSPLLLDDRIFMISDGGIASCVDARTGDLVWQRRIGGEYSASPLCAQGRIYFFSEDGDTPVVAASDEYTLLTINQLDDGFMASPAVAGDDLILRTRTHLYCIGE